MADIGRETSTGNSAPQTDKVAAPEGTKKTIMEVIRDHTMRATEVLRANLKHQGEDAGDDDIGDRTKRRVELYVAELDTLDAMLLQITKEPGSLRPVVRRFNRDAGREGFDNSATVRWAASPNLPLGPTNPQNQLGVHAVVTAPEAISEAIAAESMKGKPPETVLHGLLAKAQSQAIRVNTVAAYRNILTEGAEIDPQAGVSFVWRRGEETARVAGVTYIGRRAFISDLGLTVPYSDFYLMQRALMNAVKPQIPPASKR